MEVGGYLHACFAERLGETRHPLNRSLFGPGAGLHLLEDKLISFCHRVSNAGPPARSLVPVPTTLT
jgi:hypothetical protein